MAKRLFGYFGQKKAATTTTTANAFFGAQIRLIFCNFQLFCLARRRDVAALCANSAVIVGLGPGEGVVVVVRDGSGNLLSRWFMNQVPFTQLSVGVYTAITVTKTTTRRRSRVSILMPGQSILKSANSWWICCAAFSIPDTPFDTRSAQTDRHVSAFGWAEAPPPPLPVSPAPDQLQHRGPQKKKKANSNQIALHIGLAEVKLEEGFPTLFL